MRTYDFAPLWRSTIGFDRLFNLADAAAQHAGEDHYPPPNIERLGEDRYQISLALARSYEATSHCHRSDGRQRAAARGQGCLKANAG